jgi:hypothetical protein
MYQKPVKIDESLQLQFAKPILFNLPALPLFGGKADFCRIAQLGSRQPNRTPTKAI